MRRCRRLWAHAPVMYAASHIDHKKELHGFLFLYIHEVLAQSLNFVQVSVLVVLGRTCINDRHNMRFCFYNYGATLGGPSGRRSSAINYQNSTIKFQ